jgi:hypothetical protein
MVGIAFQGAGSSLPPRKWTRGLRPWWRSASTGRPRVRGVSATSSASASLGSLRAMLRVTGMAEGIGQGVTREVVGATCDCERMKGNEAADAQLFIDAGPSAFGCVHCGQIGSSQASRHKDPPVSRAQLETCAHAVYFAGNDQLACQGEVLRNASSCQYTDLYTCSPAGQEI